MARAVLAVVVGFVVWTALWLGGAMVVAMVFGLDLTAGGLRETGPLAAFVALSVVCSLAAGVTCSAVNGRRCGRAVPVLAGVLLLVGIGVQVPAWADFPVWYHLVFLVLLVPMTLVGGRLMSRASRD